jgi:serine O-acetyltransferase
VTRPRRPRTSADHRFYLAADLASNSLERWRWHDRYRHPIVQFPRLLRHAEYLDGRRGFYALIRVVQHWRLMQLSMKLGFTIPLHVFGPGLSLVHYGSVVVNWNARVGRNAWVHSGVNIGEAYGKAPWIGDDVYFGPGAKLFGEIKVGDGAIIGANAVVNRDVPPNVAVGGVPARVIREGVAASTLTTDGCAVAARRLGYTIDA